MKCTIIYYYISILGFGTNSYFIGCIHQAIFILACGFVVPAIDILITGLMYFGATRLKIIAIQSTEICKYLILYSVYKVDTYTIIIVISNFQIGLPISSLTTYIKLMEINLVVILEMFLQIL